MDWAAILDDNHIPYVTRGPNTKRGELSVRCPWCGEDDPSEHLGISLTTENWGCHRNPNHRGHSPYRLLAALLGCSNSQARLMAAQYSAADPETLEQALATLTGTSGHASPDAGHTEQPRLLSEFRPIEPTGSTAKFWRYLTRRGFDDVGDLTQKYDLMCCLTGRWKDRIIIPVMQQGELLAWTGRALQEPVNAPRYMSSSPAIKTGVFNEDSLPGRGQVLFVTEGPFDAIKLDYYGAQYHARATCLFGVTATIDQISILNKLRKHYKRLVILFDADAAEPAFAAAEWFSGASIGHLPDGVKDPGKLSVRQIERIITNLL